MGHVVITRHLAAPPAALWSIVIDPRTWGDWFTVHDRWFDHLPASLAEGTGLAAKVVLLGVANRIAIAPAEDGSWFTFAGGLEGTLVKGALVKAIERDCTKQAESSWSGRPALRLVHSA